MSNENLPLTFKVGNGDTIVQPTFNDGVLYINITRNSSNMSFINGQPLYEKNLKNFKNQVKQIPDVIFEFTDFELGIQFYNGFFKTPNEDIVNSLRNLYGMWHLTICA